MPRAQGIRSNIKVKAVLIFNMCTTIGLATHNKVQLIVNSVTKNWLE